MTRFYVFLLMLMSMFSTACYSAVRVTTTTENDAAALQAANMWAGTLVTSFVVGVTLVAIAWAIAWAVVKRADAKVEEAKYGRSSTRA